MNSVTSPDCCCGGGGPPPPPACPLTISLRDYCTGAPISGATVDILDGSFGTIASGSTDGSGGYTFPDPSPAGASYWSAAFDGTAYGPVAYPGLSTSYCGHPVGYCYIHGRLTVTTPADAGPSPGTVPEPLRPDVAASTPGSAVYTYKRIVPCSSAPLYDPFPVVGCVVAGGDIPGLFGVPKYIPNCGAVAVGCGGDVTVDIPLFDLTVDYWGYSQNCDLGCAGTVNPGCANTTYGEGPLHRGVFPKTLFLTINGSCKFSIPGTVTLTWNGTNWDSGCIGASGNCCGGPYVGNTINSARIIVGTGSIFGYFIGMTVYSDGACANGLGCPIGGVGGIDSFDECVLSSPVDHSATVPSSPGSPFNITYHLTE